MTSEERSIPPFQPLGSYKWPAMPTQESLRLLLGRLYGMIRQKDDEPFIAADRLQKATLEILDEIVAPPACGPVIRELDRTLAAWVADPAPVTRLKLIVLPPCDENRIVETWANENGHQIVPPPDRACLLAPAEATLPDLAGEGVLVVPRLERWFLRHRNGLALVRWLIAELDRLDRHCVVGCNSWAWAFLTKAVGADIVLPRGLTFQAFDAARLHDWFSELAVHDAARAVKFRLPSSGEDVLAVDDAGKPKGDYFETLAAHSLGIPWVAWHLWRRSLRSDGEDGSGDNDNEEITPGERTLWVAGPERFSLPDRHEDAALLTLHALLVHGGLTVEELGLVLPPEAEGGIVPALLAARLVERDDGRIACFPAAYPAIRGNLSAAGFSMDRL